MTLIRPHPVPFHLLRRARQPSQGSKPDPLVEHSSASGHASCLGQARAELMEALSMSIGAGFSQKQVSSSPYFVLEIKRYGPKDSPSNLLSVTLCLATKAIGEGILLPELLNGVEVSIYGSGESFLSRAFNRKKSRFFQTQTGSQTILTFRGIKPHAEYILEPREVGRPGAAGSPANFTIVIPYLDAP